MVQISTSWLDRCFDLLLDWLLRSLRLVLLGLNPLLLQNVVKHGGDLAHSFLRTVLLRLKHHICLLIEILFQLVLGSDVGWH